MTGEPRAIAPSTEELSGAELAARAGVGEEEIERLVTHGVLVPREGGVAPFRTVDVLKIRVARACEDGGLPMGGMAKAIRAGRLSFAFVESWPFSDGPRVAHRPIPTWPKKWALRSSRSSESWQPSDSPGPSLETR